MSQTESSPDRIGDAPVSEPEAFVPTPGTRPAAILVLVRRIDNEPNLLFMRRSEKVPSHKGQISFPGGGYKPSDRTLDKTALREAWEEVGIEPDTLKILGPLPPTETVVSNFVVHPFVAVPRDSSAPITYRPDNFEVASVFHIPLPHLLSPAALRQETWTIGGRSRLVNFYNYQNYVIWGATAMILTNFLAQIREGRWQMLF